MRELTALIWQEAKYHEGDPRLSHHCLHLWQCRANMASKQGNTSQQTNKLFDEQQAQLDLCHKLFRIKIYIIVKFIQQSGKTARW